MRNVTDAANGVKSSPATYERTRDVAERTGVTEETVRNWAKSGAIEARKVGGTWLVKAGQFDD